MEDGGVEGWRERKGWKGGGKEGREREDGRVEGWREREDGGVEGWRVREDGGVQGCVVMYVPVVCTVT